MCCLLSDDSGKAAQLFHNIMEEVLPYMNIFKTDTKDKNNSKLTDAYDEKPEIPDVGLQDPEGGYTEETTAAKEETTTAAQ